MSDVLDCGSPMGMEDRKIPDSALKATSEVSIFKYNSKTLYSTALMKWVPYRFAKCFSYEKLQTIQYSKLQFNTINPCKTY